MDTRLRTDLFLPGPPRIDKVLRAVIVYFFLVAGLKLAGRRELAELNAFDLVLPLTIANTVQNAIIGNDNSVAGRLIGATILLVVNYLVVRLAYEYRRKDRQIGSSGVILLAHGQVRHRVLRKQRISLDELREAANRRGYESLDEMERAVLDQDGTFAFTKKKDRTEDKAYREILSRIDHLAEQVGRMRPSGSPQAANLWAERVYRRTYSTPKRVMKPDGMFSTRAIRAGRNMFPPPDEKGMATSIFKSCS
jgi:uncharacterized membrane protein YcaP (DUF421 family)